jgi:hypothetical protein
LVWNVVPVLAKTSDDMNKNAVIIEKTLKKDFKDVKKYILMSDIDGITAMQVRELAAKTN